MSEELKPIEYYAEHLGIQKRLENAEICHLHHSAACPCGKENLLEARHLILGSWEENYLTLPPTPYR